MPVTAAGQTVRMLVTRPSDYVMKQHLEHRFAYEPVLETLKSQIGPDTRVLDIGAGFGNSAMYFAIACGARQVTVIEPHPEAVAVLRANGEENRSAMIDTSLLGIALAERPGRADLTMPYQTHLGGARMELADNGSIPVERGDDVLGQRDFDFILVDVNGHEAHALSGLSRLIERCRPTICASTTPYTRPRLDAFLLRRGYSPGASVELHAGKQSFDVYHSVSAKAPEQVPASLVRHLGGVVASWDQQGVAVRFFVANRHDAIQACHFAGHLYEEEELSLIARYMPTGAHVLDCGANIGNHAVAFERLMGARRIVAIEPNPTAIELLRMNVALNRLDACDLSHVGIALGSSQGRCRVGPEPPDNLGGTRIEAAAEGTCQMMRGDDLLHAERFDFIKVDVEGGEIETLEGLRSTIERDQPVLFVEVEDVNGELFAKFLASIRYRVADGYRRYRGRVNLLAAPNAARAESAPKISSEGMS